MAMNIGKLFIFIITLLSLQKALAGLEVVNHLHNTAVAQNTISSLNRLPGDNTTVNVFESSWVQFGGVNHRVIDVEVEFPEASKTYSSVVGHFSLKCPNQTKCDYWDRYGNFGFVMNKGTENEYFLEADRFITAYRVGFSWKTDFTTLRPLFTGKQTMRVFIDTWVGEGHAQGDGWLFNASIEFVGGQPPQPEAKQVIPIWPHLSWKSGQPDKPVHQQVRPVNLVIPAGKKYIFRSFISGHVWITHCLLDCKLCCMEVIEIIGQGRA
ncbi:PNGase F N-terminal domain-containing protein [Spartinivicinus poritis]|uniref:Peptide-N-glycosidase F N-terminal domain-containing protein n=1 Tax=Spartinivicinus poritis TaxID=2994640 RepID=A0ABT5UH98_9GAMM|nr:PNGase F N-terminal domain-containing protein [Spartinivicinus sp. A2-2]MDE1465585.1 hypothetical protein [Spartinivicinus sp. A2-2]